MLSANSVDESVEQWPTVYMVQTLSCETREFVLIVGTQGGYGIRTPGLCGVQTGAGYVSCCVQQLWKPILQAVYLRASGYRGVEERAPRRGRLAAASGRYPHVAGIFSRVESFSFRAMRQSIVCVRANPGALDNTVQWICRALTRQRE